jgi:multiple sugar transport system substrate-binding protein
MLNYAPPGAITFDFTARREVYQQGRVALLGNWSSSGGAFVDPRSSVEIVAKNTDVAYLPRMSRSDPPSVPFGGWALVMNKHSKQKEAAWEFIRWLSDPEIQKDYAADNGTPFRYSTLRDRELQKGRPWYELILKAEEDDLVRPEYRPRFPPWVKMEEALGLRLSEAMAGTRSVDEALRMVNDEIAAILKEEGY